MGNVFGSQVETDPGDIRNKEILEARKRYLDEQFKLDDEKEFGNAKPDPSGVNRKLRRMPSILNEIEKKAMSINPKDHSFPFENLVFEGGGSKGHAYSGAVKALEELGLVSQIKRFAGASAGAMTASLLAVGYDSKDLQGFLSQDLSLMLLDAKFGILSLLPNLLTGYGWNPAARLYNWFGELLEKKMGNKDVTFYEHYKKTGLELCIIVTNVNHMTEEYCHVKTTPDMPIRLAVRMSMAIPGLFQATHYTYNGETNTYVDGGVICNYPIHCFDGWWLSMDSNDSFLEKLQPLDDLPQLLDKRRRFARDHKDPTKTLGFLLYADSETDMFRFMCEKRIGVQLDPIPNTKLGRIKIEQKRGQEKAKREHRRVMMAVDEFLKVLKKHNLDKNHTINKTELEAAFKSDDFSKTSSEMLFGTDCTVQNAFDLLDRDKNGEINYQELINFIQGTGINLQQRFLGYQRKDISGVFDYFGTIQNAVLTNVQRAFVNPQDLDRTVGINTGHVGTSDFTLEEEDRSFAVAQGYKSTMTFLKYFAAKEELLKNADESLRKRIRSLSTNREDDVKEEDENDDDTHDDVIKGNNE
ncbi:uncharacterized protein LOC128163053 [Crassostrea angulata]|uniref:uncharacterized protein LOC128163053 n=1 Tax=Magallana angulata TaxID=2784310 RepID=UPI0022B08AF9|nr:uncharacterized protein LOC128163053 [Crassostrea angulata]XP_052682471.1 uncharacterized protein LOC128163053 [Crassostrea angulata]XP_052682472.1 uncharacterized protein LOC128163053 [Crassostrea angulata]